MSLRLKIDTINELRNALIHLELGEILSAYSWTHYIEQMGEYYGRYDNEFSLARFSNHI